MRESHTTGERPRLASPPRRVAWPVRARLLANPMTFGGALVFGLGCLVAVGLLLSSNPGGNFGLWTDGATTPGRVVRIEKTGYQESNATVYRHTFEFAVPSGRIYQGRSYARGLTHRGLALNVDLPPEARPEVVVEYVPSHPHVCRIRGERMGPASLVVVGFLTAPAAAGAAFLLGGLVRGARRARLLAVGEEAHATLITCEGAREGSYREIPFEEYQKARASKSTRIDDLDLDADLAAEPEGRGAFGRLLSWWVRGFMIVWFGVLLLILVLGTVGLGGSAAAVLLGRMEPSPVLGRPASRIEFAAFLLVLMAGWIGFGALMFRFGLRARHTFLNPPSARPDALPEDEHEPVVCTFSFLPAHADEPVWAKDLLPLSPETSARVTALYDPMRSTRALLVDSLAPRIQVGPDGAWESPHNGDVRLRLALAAFAVVLGPVLGWVIWRMVSL